MDHRTIRTTEKISVLVGKYLQQFTLAETGGRPHRVAVLQAKQHRAEIQQLYLTLPEIVRQAKRGPIGPMDGHCLEVTQVEMRLSGLLAGSHTADAERQLLGGFLQQLENIANRALA